jgi:hypothetical protein
MALILKYRVEPHPGISNEIYQALAEQVGKVGIQMQLKIGPPENSEETMVIVHGQFISVEGEHYQDRLNVDSRTPEELAHGPSSREADRAASESS